MTERREKNNEKFVALGHLFVVGQRTRSRGVQYDSCFLANFLAGL